MNAAIFYFLYSAGQIGFLKPLVIFFGEIFPFCVMFFALVFLLWHHEVFSAEHPLGAFAEKWKEIVLVFFTGGFAWVIAHVLKALIHSARPSLFFLQVQALFVADGYAFPSGHAALFFALARSILFFHKKAGYTFFFFAVLISVARVMAGVHSPIDIFGGFVVGSLVAYAVEFLYNRFAYLPKNV
jgi:undecaprenyl-diphosphatase